MRRFSSASWTRPDLLRRKRTIRSLGRTFVVRRGVFDPKRHLSGLAFARALPELLEERVDAYARVHDLGTGCGVLAAAAREVVKTVVATDISERAVKVAETNLEDLNVEVRAGDLFTPVWGEWFDVTVMNPPYEIGPTSDLTLGSPDLLERFGAQIHEYAARALIGWPADDADVLRSTTGLPLTQVAEIPTKGDTLGVFEWQANPAS